MTNEQSGAADRAANAADVFGKLHKQTLFRAFCAFRRSPHLDCKLGIDDFMILIEAIGAGLGADGPGALAQLCATLWAKTPEQTTDLLKLLRDLQQQEEAELAALAASIAAPKTPLEQDTPKRKDDEAPNIARDVNTDTISQNTSEKTTRPHEAEDGGEEWQPESLDAVLALQMARERNLRVLGDQPLTLRTDYMPVSRRQMGQSWRYLRRPLREGPRTELDLPATIQKAAREGLMLAPVRARRNENHAALLMLIDRDGSMVPFHGLTRDLLDTAQNEGKLRSLNPFYFHDCPDAHVFADAGRVDGIAKEDWFRAPCFGPRTAVLIVSDAGAARGKLEAERALHTQLFIQEIRLHAGYVAWLNPMPRHRWRNTTAEQVAQHVPMFDLSRAGLDTAINVLRGRNSIAAAAMRAMSVRA